MGKQADTMGAETGEDRCPECGSPESEHEDNGVNSKSVNYTIRCTVCNAQWSPNER